MAEHNDLGVAAEDLAAAWLTGQGFLVRHRNWRYKQYEIDIIATKNSILHFIEVKSRNYSRFGHPEGSVTRKKFNHLKRAADEFLFLHPGHKWIQYDIIAITLFKNKPPEIFLLEDVYL